MRLITYLHDGEFRSAVELDGRAFDSAAVAASAGLADSGVDWSSNRAIVGLGADVHAAITAAADQLAAAGDPGLGTVASLTLGPPITDPDKIICLGANYRDHAAEAGMDLPEVPMLFAKFRNSLVGPGAPIVLPGSSDQVDYEAELAIVIGTRCKAVSRAEALDYVFGAMALNDVSARDLQKQTSQWLAGKAPDTFAPCGPALVSAGALGDLQQLAISAKVNGELVQDSNTSQMIFSIAETIEFISGLMTLEPGDIVATGTPAGVGVMRDPQVLLHDGDLVEIAIEGIGSLPNPVQGPVRAAAGAGAAEAS